MSLTFRPATPADWEAIAALLTGAGLTLEGARECVTDFTLAYRDDVLVGSAAVETYPGGVGLLRSVATSGDERGRGTGRDVVLQALARARGAGLAEVVLLTPGAAGFFARLGFTRIAREDAPADVRRSLQFTQVQCLSAAVMRLPLNG